MNICIIPARSGSKRIKNKNIKKFFGKPLIYYSIKLALKSKIFNQVIVSTDSKRIAKIATKLGATVPYLRSKKNSNDKTPINEVLKEVILKLKVKEKFIFCLYPTAPLLKVQDLKKGLKKINKKYDQIIVISEYASPIQRAFKKIGKSFIKFIDSKYKFYRSQDLEKTYFDTGTFAIYKNSVILNYENIKSPKIGYVEIDKYSAVDINDDGDFKYAKLLFSLKK